jgi:hypothetical protein
MDNSSGSRTTADNQPLLITLDYQQRHTCSGSEIASDGNYEPLQMTFFVVVFTK